MPPSQASSSQARQRGRFWWIPQSRWHGLVLLGILLLAGYLRVSHMDLVGWGRDEAVASMNAVVWLQGGQLPQVGDVYSVGVRSPPLSYYLITPFFVGTCDPTYFGRSMAIIGTLAVLLCYLIGRKYFSERVGLIAAALFASAPWAVMLARCFSGRAQMAMMAVVLLWCLCLLVVDRKPKQFFWVVVLTLAAGQVHLAGTALVLVVAVVWLVFRFPLNWKAGLLGLGVAGVPMLPYLQFQVQHDWEDFRRATAVVEGAGEQLPYTVTGLHPQGGFPLPDREHLAHLLNLASGLQIEDYLGLSTPEFHAQASMGAAHGLMKIYRLVILAVLLAAGGLLVRAALRSPRFPYFDLTAHANVAILVIWLIGGVLFFHITGLKTYLHYFAFALPVPFLLVGWGLDKFEGLAVRRGGWLGRALPRAVYAFLILLVIAQAAYVLGYYRLIDQKGPFRGTQGVPYKYQLALAETIAQAAQTSTPIVSTDWPPKTPPGESLQYLIWWKLKERGLPPAAQLGGTRQMFLVLDAAPSAEQQQALAGRPVQTFGALRLYEMSSAALRLPGEANPLPR